MGFVEDAALRFEGFNDQQIAEIKAAMPDLENLLKVLKDHLPQINRVVPAVKMAVQVYNQHQKELGL